MKKILYISLLTLTFAIIANAQNKESFTYRDMLNQQKIERDELKQTQKEIFTAIMVREKEELEKIDGVYTSTYSETLIRHKDERKEIVILQTSEHEKQMQIQAEERKDFNQKP